MCLWPKPPVWTEAIYSIFFFFQMFTFMLFTHTHRSHSSSWVVTEIEFAKSRCEKEEKKNLNRISKIDSSQWQISKGIIICNEFKYAYFLSMVYICGNTVHAMHRQYTTTAHIAYSSEIFNQKRSEKRYAKRYHHRKICTFVIYILSFRVVCEWKMGNCASGIIHLIGNSIFQN